jgi:rhodanese-related sulfurtransferase
MSETPIEIDCPTVKAKLDANENFMFLDCREANEYDTVKIDGATLFPMSEIQEKIGELDGHQTDQIVIHCHHGGRSLRVANWMRQQGYANAQSMAGGIDLWALEIEPGMTRY